MLDVKGLFSVFSWERLSCAVSHMSNLVRYEIWPNILTADTEINTRSARRPSFNVSLHGSSNIPIASFVERGLFIKTFCHRKHLKGQSHELRMRDFLPLEALTQ